MSPVTLSQEIKGFHILADVVPAIEGLNTN